MFWVFLPVPRQSIFVAQCSEIITQEIHFVWEPWLTGEIFMMKTQNQMRMKITAMRKKNYHHHCNENRKEAECSSTHTYIIICHLWAFSCSILHLLVICWSQRLTDTTTSFWTDMIENKPSSRRNEFQNVSISGNYCMNWPQHMWQILGPLTRAELIFTPFYPNNITQDYILHIWQYFHFTDNDKDINKNNMMTFMTDYG